MDPLQFATVIDPASITDKSIIELLGIQGATDDQKQQIIDDALATIHTRIIARILDSIPEPEQAPFDQLLESGDNEKIKQYLLQRGIDVTRIASEEALNYKVEIFGLVKENANSARNIQSAPQPIQQPQQPTPQPLQTSPQETVTTQHLPPQQTTTPSPFLTPPLASQAQQPTSASQPMQASPVQQPIMDPPQTTGAPLDQVNISGQ